MRLQYIIILLGLIFNVPALAKEITESKTYVPQEYRGYMVYETLDSRGDKVVVESPVRYKIIPDNDESYEYRNYRIEIERVKDERALKDKTEIEERKINSAVYYPLYFD